jgi:hypothetical protein
VNFEGYGPGGVGMIVQVVPPQGRHCSPERAGQRRQDALHRPRCGGRRPAR